MYCPECGSRLQNGYCSKCRATYQVDVIGLKSAGQAQKRKCPKCNGELVLVGEKKVGLLLPPVGVKSKIYRCSSCGYEASDKNLGSMLSDENIDQIRKDLKIDDMRKKIKKFVNEKL